MPSPVFKKRKRTSGPRWPCIAHLITRQVWVNWRFGSREEVQYWFSRWRPSWISNQNSFSYFWSASHLATSNEVWVNCPFGSGEKVKNRFSTWLLGQPSWISDQNDFSYFWSTLPIKFRVNGPFYSKEENQNRFSRWQLWRPTFISDRNDFSCFWSTSHLNDSYQVSSQ